MTARFRKMFLAAWAPVVLNSVNAAHANSQPEESSASEQRADTLGTSLFVGAWVNEDRNTGGGTRAEIGVEMDTVFVHMWGACSPLDCDWGEETTSVSDARDSTLVLSWTFRHKTERHRLTALPDGRLQVVRQAHYTDGLKRERLEFFLRLSTETPTRGEDSIPEHWRDPRIEDDAIPTVGQHGHTRHDVDVLWRGANWVLKTGRCSQIDYAARSMLQPGEYFVGCSGGRTISFTEGQIWPELPSSGVEE